MKHRGGIYAGSIVAITAALALALPAKPSVTIDYKTHERLWRAQRAMVTAYEHIEAAPEIRSGDWANHARKAQDLLIKADRELRLAAAPILK